MRTCSRTSLIASLLASLLVGPSCAHLGVGAGGDDVKTRIAEVDALLRLRQDPQKLDEAEQAIGDLMLDLGDDPRLLSRLAMVHYARAYGHDAPQPPPLRIYEAGREAAWRCLYQDPSFQGVLSSTGGRIGVAAAARIGEDQTDCLLWLVANWSRWLALRDPAGVAIDLQSLQVLADRAVDLTAGYRRAMALDLAGMSRAMAPLAFGPDMDEAHSLFQRAIQHDPDNLSIQVDLAEFVYGPLEDERRFRDTLQAVLDASPQSGRWQLENQRALQRAEALLVTARRPNATTPDQPGG